MRFYFDRSWTIDSLKNVFHQVVNDLNYGDNDDLLSSKFFFQPLQVKSPTDTFHFESMKLHDD